MDTPNGVEAQSTPKNNTTVEKQLTQDEIAFFTNVFNSVDYAALVSNVSKDVASQTSDEWGTYTTYNVTVEVHETFWGPSLSTLTYEVDEGDPAPMFKEPHIIMLCKTNDIFRWPGVGASERGTKEYITLARNLGNAVEKVPTDPDFVCR